MLKLAGIAAFTLSETPNVLSLPEISNNYAGTVLWGRKEDGFFLNHVAHFTNLGQGPERG